MAMGSRRSFPTAKKTFGVGHWNSWSRVGAQSRLGVRRFRPGWRAGHGLYIGPRSDPCERGPVVIAGKRLPVVFHVGARAITSQSLNIHCRHDDVMGVADYGWECYSDATPRTRRISLLSHAAEWLEALHTASIGPIARISILGKISCTRCRGSSASPPSRRHNIL